jgi:hypothetical protein
MNLIHWSAEPIQEIQSVKQSPEGGMKPAGFWVSDESTDWGWYAWATAEAFHLDALTYATPISLVPDHRVAILHTRTDLRRWTDDYGMALPGTESLPWSRREGMAIDWACVAQDYQGVIITPYQWSLRLDERCFWYYGWDCASGCIWDATAIGHIGPSRRVEQQSLAEEVP